MIIAERNIKKYQDLEFKSEEYWSKIFNQDDE